MLEKTFEDLMLKNLVPGSPSFLLHSQHSLQEILSDRWKFFVNFQGFSLNIFDELENGFGSPGSFAV